MSKNYVFIIDTDSYSGNFNRELCAFVTGQLGECEVGDRETQEFFDSVSSSMFESFETSIERKPNDKGHYHPSDMYPTPGMWNDGMGEHYPDDIFEEELNQAYNYYVYHCEEYGLTPAERSNWPKKYPAYESVGIFFNTKPTQEMLDLMKSRAKIFLDRNKIGLRGFRLVLETTSREEVEIEI